MKRIDKIYHYIVQNSGKLTVEEMKAGAGFSASFHIRSHLIY